MTSSFCKFIAFLSPVAFQFNWKTKNVTSKHDIVLKLQFTFNINKFKYPSRKGDVTKTPANSNFNVDENITF